MKRHPIFPPTRAIEHVLTLPGVVPLRIFKVLWPLWQVETTATARHHAGYDLIDRFLMRGMAEAGIDTADGLAEFFGLQPRLVARCLAFLSTIQHVTERGGRLVPTELGTESLRDGVRYEWRQSRQKLLVERHTSTPLPRDNYGGTLLTESMREAERWFVPLFAYLPFRPEVVLALEHHPDRDRLNLPKKLRDLRVDTIEQVWLPAYVVETGDQDLLVYSEGGPERDPFLEDVCRRDRTLRERLLAPEHPDQERLWTEWARQQRVPVASLQRLGSGVWRATVAADAFTGGSTGGFGRGELGSYRAHKDHFVQLWCDDEGTRCARRDDRAFELTQRRDLDTTAAFRRRLDLIAAQLEVPPVTVDRLRGQAKSMGRHDVVNRLDELV
jgi:hypothetical protein